MDHLNQFYLKRDKRENGGGASKTTKIVLVIILGIALLGVLFFSLSGAIRAEYRENHFDEYYQKMISPAEKALVYEAFSQGPEKMEIGTEDHLRLLFKVLWLFREENEIDIVAAEVVPFSNADVADIAGKCQDGYALKVIMDTGDTYTVWKSKEFERILKNDSEEIWIVSLLDRII